MYFKQLLMNYKYVLNGLTRTIARETEGIGKSFTTMMEFPALWLNAQCHTSYKVRLTILYSTALKTFLRQLETMFDFITHWLDWLERGWFVTTVTIRTTTKDQSSNVKIILCAFVALEVVWLFLRIKLSFHRILCLASLIYTADLSSCSNRC